MKLFPIYLNLDGERVIVSGAGQIAAAKLRLLMKTNADISVYGAAPTDIVAAWAKQGRIQLERRAVQPEDCVGARILYAASGDDNEDKRVADLARQRNILVNVVDNLDASDFITPAIVDRDPVTIAIGTEGTAPVLARRIKAELEAQLSSKLGTLAKIASGYRQAINNALKPSARRQLWADFFNGSAERALNGGGEDAVHAQLHDLIEGHALNDEVAGTVSIIGAGPGDPDLLTMRARRLISEADVVIHDRLVPQAVLEIARREATIIEAGKQPFAKSWQQEDINTLMVEHAGNGSTVVRLKSGDPTIYGRLDEEMDALDDAGIDFEIIPGITSAIAAAARAKVSLTRRHRNSSLRILTGHDVDGFAEQDWRSLAEGGTVAAIYMGVRASRFLQGRLMLHGASPDTPIGVIENVSCDDQQTVAATLGTLPQQIEAAGITGPAIIFLGIAPRSEAFATKETNTAFMEAL